MQWNIFTSNLTVAERMDLEVSLADLGLSLYKVTSNFLFRGMKEEEPEAQVSTLAVFEPGVTGSESSIH